MEKEQINVAELLKDCPKGMELDCTTWENVTFEEVRNNTIIVRRNNKEPIYNKAYLNQYGCYTNYSDEKCRIFPKGKTTWEGFVLPYQFKVGGRIKSRITKDNYTIIDRRKDFYVVYGEVDKYSYHIPFSMEDNYELLPDKFDITTLKPFDKVFVRDTDTEEWCISFF